MVSRKDEDNLVCDMKGPAKKPLRLAIKVRDLLNLDSSLKRTQQVVTEDRALKNASQEDIDKLAPLESIFSDHTLLP